MDKFRIVHATTKGPKFYSFDSFEEMAMVLMGWHQSGHQLGDKTASAWKRTRNTWARIWKWQGQE